MMLLSAVRAVPILQILQWWTSMASSMVQLRTSEKSRLRKSMLRGPYASWLPRWQ